MITTTVASLKAASAFMGTEERRPYLKGVLFQRGLLIATDWHRMAVIKPEIYTGSADDFILPDEVIKKILAVKVGKRERALLVLNTEAKTASVHIEKMQEPEAIFKYEPIDGTYPEWRRVIPDISTYETSSPAGFNSKYLADFKAFGQHITIYPNASPSSPMIIRGKTNDFDALGVLMPMRIGADEMVIPDWLEPKTEEKEVA